MGNKRKVLLIMPDFYSYTAEITQLLEKMQLEVTCVYEEPPRIAFLILRKINRILGKNKGYYLWNKVLWKKISNKGTKYDYLIVIRGNIIESWLAERIKKELLTDRARSVYYTWDSFEYLVHKGALADDFDKAFSFDREDVQKQQKYQLLPLFYLKEFAKNSIQQNEEAEYDMCCIASFNLFRYRELRKIERYNPDLRIYIQLYIDRKLYNYKKKEDKEFADVDERYLVFTPLGINDVIDYCMKSKSVLDITDEKQVGLSMRTIESVGMKKKLITNNKDVIYYNFFSEENVMLIDKEQNYKISRDWLTGKYEIDEKVWKSYSAENWVNVLAGQDEMSEPYIKEQGLDTYENKV